MSANEELLDAQIRHAIYVQRFGGSQVNRFIALLNRADGELVDVISTRIARIAERGYDAGPDTTKRLEQVLASIRELNVQAYGEAGRELTKTLAEFAVYERDWNIAQIEQPLPVAVNVIQPAAEIVTAAALKRPFQGRLLKEWLGGVEEARAVRVRDAIRLGLVEGEPIDKMVRRIRGTRAAGYQDGLLEIDRRGAAAMVRTAVNHTSNAARQEVFSANSELQKGVRWVSTLDGKTSAICRGRDGKIYPVNSGPRPPAHIGCRSAMAPVLKSWRELGIDVDDAPPGTRASLNGQVPADLTYEQWLRKQPVEFQDEVLGKAKGALFRTGKVSLDRFVDGSGKELSLKQLQEVEPAAFAKAGIKPKSVKFEQPAASGRFADQFDPVKADVSTPARAAMVKFEESIRGRDREIAAFFDDNGTLHSRRTGLPDRVSFPTSVTDQMAGKSFTHNHPGDTSFSISDVLNASDIGLSELRAVGPEMRYIMQPGAAGWPKELAIRGAYDESKGAAVESAMEMLRRNEIGMKDLEGHAVHLIWNGVARSLGLSYLAERS